MSDSNTPVIVEAVRTARGKKKGTLAGTHSMDLAAHTLRAVLRRTGLDPKCVEDVVLGCVTQVGEQGGTSPVAPCWRRACPST